MRSCARRSTGSGGCITALRDEARITALQPLRLTEYRGASKAYAHTWMRQSEPIDGCSTVEFAGIAPGAADPDRRVSHAQPQHGFASEPRSVHAAADK